MFRRLPAAAVALGIILAGLLLASLSLPAARAQSAPEAAPAAAVPAAAPAMTQEQVDSLLASLDDTKVRETLRSLLLSQAEATAAKPAPSTILVVRQRLEAFFGAWPRMPQALRNLATAFVDGELAGFLAYAAGLACFGGVAAWLVARAIRRSRRPRPPGSRSSAMLRALTALGGVVIRLTSLLALLAGLSLGSLLLGDHGELGQAVVSVIANEAVFLIAVFIALDVLLAPKQRAAALLNLRPLDHGKVFFNAMILTAGLTVLSAIGRLLLLYGMEKQDVLLLSVMVSSAFLLWLILLPWRWRGALQRAVATLLPKGSTAYNAIRFMPLILNFYVVAVWLAAMDSLLAGGAQASEHIVLAMLLPAVVFSMARSLSQAALAHLSVPRVTHHHAVAAGHGPPVAAADSVVDEETEIADFKRLLSSTASVFQAIWMIAGILVAVIYLWLFKINLAGVLGLEAGSFDALMQVCAVLLAAHVLYALMSATIDRRIALLDEEERPSRAKRLKTLLPLLRWLLIVVIIVMAVLISLSEFGVNIAPLIAGAGVFGLALGLGTQKLVTDIVSGVFFLIDDAFSIGDYIDVEGKKGTIEAITIRSMKLRHHLGALHNVPFGHITAVTNYTRDWAVVRLEFRLPSSTDLQLVKKIIKDIGKEIATDPELSPGILEPLKSQGVRRFEDNAMIIGVKFMAIPGTQFVIRKFVYQRIRDSFKKAGIHFADRGVVVRVDSDHAEAGAAADTAAAGAAAKAAIERATKPTEDMP